MAKEIAGQIKLQIKGGAANPSPPVGPALGSKGINIMEFCKQFNARTQDKAGKVLPVVITYYSDKSFDFVVKTPPVAIQVMEAAKVKGGSAEPNRKKSGRDYLGTGKSNRRGQIGRFELFYGRIGDENGCWYSEKYGYHRKRGIPGK